MGSAIFEYNKGQSSKYEKILHSIYILFLQEQKFGLFHHLEKNEAQNKKKGPESTNISHIGSAILEYNKCRVYSTGLQGTGLAETQVSQGNSFSNILITGNAPVRSRCET